MLKPDRQVLESLARIGFSEKPFVDWLDASLEDAQSRLVSQVDEVQMRILQGRAQGMMELKKLIKEAPELCRKA